jgi:hypothetical protein
MSEPKVKRGAYTENSVCATGGVVRVPRQWEFDRIAARRPEMYGPITESDWSKQLNVIPAP